MKTNSKIYKTKINDFLLSSISFEECEDLTNRQKVEYLFSTFNQEFNHEYNKKHYPNYQLRIANWLQGLPSCIDIPFTYCDILELAKSLHDVKEFTEKQEDTILSNYFNHIAFHLIKLGQTFNVKFNY